jgi:hypothetical protein
MSWFGSNPPRPPIVPPSPHPRDEDQCRVILMLEGGQKVDRIVPWPVAVDFQEWLKNAMPAMFFVCDEFAVRFDALTGAEFYAPRVGPAPVDPRGAPV